MKVVHNIRPGEDPINFLGFEELAEEGLGTDCIFFYAGEPHPSVTMPSDKKKVFFTTEEQAWDKDTTDNCLEHVDKILTICPPEITGRSKREYVFFPFNEKYIPQPVEKEFDAIYCGAATGPHVEEILRSISKYNYRFVSFSQNSLVTDKGVGYLKKLELIAKSKVFPIHNLTGSGTPQIKTRPFEAAFSKTLILCKKDSWNIIEKWFEPKKEFLYYSSESELVELLNTSIKNYDQYQDIINAAYEKAINSYTTRHFIKRYLDE